MALSLIRFTRFRLFLILLSLQDYIPKVVDTTRKMNSWNAWQFFWLFLNWLTAVCKEHRLCMSAFRFLAVLRYRFVRKYRHACLYLLYFSVSGSPKEGCCRKATDGGTAIIYPKRLPPDCSGRSLTNKLAVTYSPAGVQYHRRYRA